MDYSSTFFGKPLSRLTYEDVVNFFNEPQQETEAIEFKSFSDKQTFDAALQNVIRGISAFLNSSGGILIWGAPRGSKPEGKKEDIFTGELAPVNELYEKDRLINKIGSAITPLPVGVTVKILSEADRHLYVFEIQQSSYKPHQYDGRYFIRLDGQTKPAPHYLVDAMIKQVSYPNINAVIKFSKMQLVENGIIRIDISVGMFNFSELQNEEAVSFRILCVGGYFPKGIGTQSAGKKQRYNMNNHQVICDNFAAVLHYGTPHIYDDIIFADYENLRKNKDQVDLVLSFGGKKSPAKSSTYKLSFSGNFDLSKPQSQVILSEENKMFAERQQKQSIKETLSFFKAF